MKIDKLRVGAAGRPVGVDRENRIVKGYVVALAGPFKSEGRGEFDEASLAKIVELWPQQGLKSRWTHPTESSDGLGKYLGRAKDPYLSKATVQRDGKPVEVPAVRADLHLSKSAGQGNPNGDLAEYVLGLAEEDADALSSSLVLSKDEEYRLSKDGSRLTSESGDPLLPLWRPRRLYATDVVDEGDAVDGILSPVPRYTRDYLERGASLLDSIFAGLSRAEVRARSTAWLSRYLDRRYGTVQQHRLGATLGGVLDDYIEQAASDERPREIILNQMAEASGLGIEEVSAILAGEDAGVTAAVLEAFAQVLGAPLSELIAAAEADGIDFAAGAEEGEGDAPTDPPADAPAPAPDAPAPMSRKPSILRRRLALKEKA